MPSSPPIPDRRRRAPRRIATVFAAIGDETRWQLLTRLASGQRPSIAELTAGTAMTRQAVTKHLRVLHAAGLVQHARAGRALRYELQPQRLDEARSALERIGRQWDDALLRLKLFVEADTPPAPRSSASRTPRSARARRTSTRKPA